ncbi:Toll-like receptor 6 [Camelus dromedarius]|uniref:Toll-like receptor n=1 Tax=Camelus dromedarius TaxID=9838 RepID=A0A5N4EH82_CAMDR|nr:Toll-like receptor 6 [Camelus dromedarius]
MTGLVWLIINHIFSNGSMNGSIISANPATVGLGENLDAYQDVLKYSSNPLRDGHFNTMTKDKDSTVRSFHFVYIMTLIFVTIIQFSDESEFVVDMSKLGLTHVPKDLPPETKVLDLSQNNISELHLSDVSFLSGLKVLRLSRNRIQCLDVSIFKFNQDLEYLDLSHNRLQKVSCHPIMSLKHLDLSFNDFDALPICKEFGNLTQLNFLGLSATKFQQLDLLPIAHLHLSCILLDLEGYYVKENEKESLQILNTEELHLVFHPNNFFSVQVNISVNSLRVKVLDLHNNRIRSIPKDVTSLEALQELNVAFNFLVHLPGCGTFSSLSVLIIDYNSVSNPSADFFQSCQKIRSLKAGNNPFQCTCELRDFIQGIGQVPSEVVEDWPDSYKCDYPESYKGTPLKDFHVSQLSCNTALLIVTIGVTGLLVAVTVTVLCIYLDLLWYLRMLCQWTQTRHRARNVPLAELQRTLQFHAFISYSEHDSAWVKNELVPCLEKEDIKICLHERNFVPGKSIVENIINCIEKSYKSIFVLSPNFVQSEWCHYELYFAHHNLFHEGSNNLILILLEPIPQNSIPGKYHKLRALMAQRTYLEWPKEKSKHGLFWANIRAAFNMKLTLITKNDDVPT